MTVTKVVDKLEQEAPSHRSRRDLQRPRQRRRGRLASARTAWPRPARRAPTPPRTPASSSSRRQLYTASSNTVALTPKKPFALTKPVQLLVYGTGPTCPSRRPRPRHRRRPQRHCRRQRHRDPLPQERNDQHGSPNSSRSQATAQPHRRHRRRARRVATHAKNRRVTPSRRADEIDARAETRRSAQAIASVIPPHASGLSRS